jgi:hypothetical protein
MKPGRTKTSRETSHAALGSADGIGILAIRKTSMPLRKNHRTSELIQIQGLRENSGSFPGIDLAAGKTSLLDRGQQEGAGRAGSLSERDSLETRSALPDQAGRHGSFGGGGRLS